MKGLLAGLLLTISSTAFAGYPAFLYGGGSRNEPDTSILIKSSINPNPEIESWVLILRPDVIAKQATLPSYFIEGFMQKRSCETTGETLIKELKAAKLMFVASCARIK
jgi:hypothetical protein